MYPEKNQKLIMYQCDQINPSLHSETKMYEHLKYLINLTIFNEYRICIVILW